MNHDEPMQISGMKMAFTTSFRGVPILFQSWAPTSQSAFFGSVVIIFTAAFCLQALLYARFHLHAKCSKAIQRLDVSSDSNCTLTTQNDRHLRNTMRVYIELQRVLLAFSIAILGYALMLIAMTYVVVLCAFKSSLMYRGTFWLCAADSLWAS